MPASEPVEEPHMKGDRITPLSFDRPEAYRYNGMDPGTIAD